MLEKLGSKEVLTLKHVSCGKIDIISGAQKCMEYIDL